MDGQVNGDAPVVSGAPVVQAAPSEPVTVPEPKAEKGDGVQKHSKGATIGLIVLAILMICGVAFGIFELTQVSQKDNEIASLKQQIANCANSNNNTTVVCPDGSSVEVTNVLDNNAAQTIVNPYLVHFGAFDNLLDKQFDVNAKMKVAFENLKPGNARSSDGDNGILFFDVDYYTFNDEYTYLFGNSQEIEKRNYDTPYFEELSFNQSAGSREYFKFGLGGIGGSGMTMFSRVKGAQYDNEKLIIDVYHDNVPWCEALENAQPGAYCVKSYSLADSENITNLIKDFSDRIPVYGMVFEKSNGHYVLTSVQKRG